MVCAHKASLASIVGVEGVTVGVNAPCCEPVTICIAMCLIAKCEPLQLSHALTLSNAMTKMHAVFSEEVL